MLERAGSDVIYPEHSHLIPALFETVEAVLASDESSLFVISFIPRTTNLKQKGFPPLTRHHAPRTTQHAHARHSQQRTRTDKTERLLMFKTTQC
jgi:hypothetical protein